MTATEEKRARKSTAALVGVAVLAALLGVAGGVYWVLYRHLFDSTPAASAPQPTLPPHPPRLMVLPGGAVLDDSIVLPETITDKEWACGNEGNDLSTRFSLLLVLSNCPDKRDKFHDCCKVHDECYANQGGKEQCDNAFCQCLAHAAVGHGICATEIGPKFCMSVREYGEKPYTNCSPVNGGCSPADMERKANQRAVEDKALLTEFKRDYPELFKQPATTPGPMPTQVGEGTQGTQGTPAVVPA